MNDSRLKLLSAAFRNLPRNVAGREMRPLTAGSLDHLLRTGNSLFVDRGEDPPEAASGDEERALVAYVWLHSAPIKEVIRTVDDLPRFHQLIEEFSFTLELADMAELLLAMKDAAEQVEAALAVPDQEDPTAEPGKPHPNPEPSPTGSPPSSTTSAATPPASEKTGSSGGSPCPAPSNTSTPLTADPAPAAPGPPAVIPTMPVTSAE